MKNKITIHTKKVKFRTAPEFYGLFFEDINHAADGGLYPEMIRNRAFEDSLVPEGCITDKEQKIFITEHNWPGAFNHGEGMDEWAEAVLPTDIPGWYSENAQMELLTTDTLNQNRKAALRVLFLPHGKIYNIGYCGIPIEKGTASNFYFMVKSNCKTKITISLENTDKEICGQSSFLIEMSREYKRYDCQILAEKTDYNGRICISSEKSCELIIGFTSLLPEKTFKNHGLREDLAIALKNTHAKFLRFPGGCVVEGINEPNAMRFSKTIGPVWERPSVQLMWHYRATNGLGFHEYLQLCEDLQMEAMYVCNCGMDCQARNGGGFSQKITQEYLEEALHALEYALGTSDTPYGKLRAINGRKEPFHLKYVEIGNENWGPEYTKRYELFYRTLKKTYPKVIFISNAHTEREKLTTEYVDEHYYDAPEFFLESGNLFDGYDRKGQRIFLGEYAVKGGNTIASMECALAESVFLLGAEKNQDIVRLTAYAPLFQNANYTAWKPNLIVFNNHEVYGIPSYHAISLLGKYRGDEVLTVEENVEMCPPVYRGVSGIMCEKEGLEIRNVKINGKTIELSACIYGEARKNQDTGGYQMYYGGERHRFTGKSKEWNEAFESFITDGGRENNALIWGIFGEEELEEYTFEAEVKMQKDNPVTFSIWNHCPNTDAGCNEPRDTNWTVRSVRNQIWKIENGVSMTRSPHMFEKPLTPEEQTLVTIDYTKYNCYKIVCNHFGYTCYINDKLVDQKRHVLHPLVSAVAVQDREHVYLKAVNVYSHDLDIQIKLDCSVDKDGEVEILQGALQEVNSFECKNKISAIKKEIICGNDFVYHIPAHSVNVIKIKKGLVDQVFREKYLNK